MPRQPSLSKQPMHQDDKPSPTRRSPKSPGVGEPTDPKSVLKPGLHIAALEPFLELDTANLSPLLDRIGDAEVVLIGEATHGTAEFYRMRAAITRALITQKGFTIVAAEADWPDCAHLDDYVRLRPSRIESPTDVFSRFPDWMWRNTEVLDFVTWLRAHNETQPEAHRRVGFYGLDVYSLYRSIHEVIAYLENTDPHMADLARQRYGCLFPFRDDPTAYGASLINQRFEDCAVEVSEILHAILEKRLATHTADEPHLFEAEQNARVVKNAERYYRLLFHSAARSWNLRDEHMLETLKAIRRHRLGAKAVVWAHNSHVGDASATEFTLRGELNLGQLARREWADRSYRIGFGTHAGTVYAANDWGTPGRVMALRPSRPSSYERLFHESGVDRFFLPLRRVHVEGVREFLSVPRPQRAIGVVYRPETEATSHYFDAILPDQFDEFIWINDTHALAPLGPSIAHNLPHTHPFLLRPPRAA